MEVQILDEEVLNNLVLANDKLKLAGKAPN